MPDSSCCWDYSPQVRQCSERNFNGFAGITPATHHSRQERRGHRAERRIVRTTRFTRDRIGDHNTLSHPNQ
jgi:hypothetical protein